MRGELSRWEVSPSPGQAVLRVLVAEDNPVNQIVVASILDLFGVFYEIVGDGAAAIEAWRRGGVDLILMDDRMPVMDGVSAVRGIRAIEAAEGRSPIAILMLTANAMPGQVADYLRAGANGYVAKPIDVQAFQEAITSTMMETAVEAVA